MRDAMTVFGEITESMKATWMMMPNWKWIGLALAFILGYLLLQVSRPLFEGLKTQIQKRVPSNSWFSFLLQLEIHRPLAWIVVASFWLTSWKALALPEPIDDFLMIATKLLLFVFLLRLAYLGVEAVGHLLITIVRKTQNTMDDQLVPFATKALKVLVVVVGVLLMLENLGLKVFPLLAGFGLGGLALALAAQDTAANFFGSIMILTDKPFQVGDFVKITDTTGTVEDVGFRSTRVRTVDNSVVTIPNSIVAKEKIDNLQLRLMRRVRHVIGITYGTSQRKIELFVDTVKQVISAHPHVAPNQTTVALQGMGDFSLQILVQTYLTTNDWNVEMQTQQEILLDIMHVAEQLQIEFAFPTQTLFHNLPPEMRPPTGTKQPLSQSEPAKGPSIVS